MIEGSNEVVGTQAKAQTLNLASLSVLVIDDNDYSMSLMTSVLKALEVGRILTARSVVEGINLLQLSAALAEDGRHPEIDIVIAEMVTSSGYGVEVLQWLRTNQREKMRFLPFIMMSGYADRKHVERSRDHGANEFLSKPFSVNSIALRLISVIDRPRPFVKSPTYFGPDRRRRDVSYLGQERRLNNRKNVEIIRERD